MSTDKGQEFVTEVIDNSDKWSQLVSKQSPLSPKQASKVLGFWSTISNFEWGDRWETPHLYVNRQKMDEFGFPPGSIDCKILHEQVEAGLCLNRTPKLEAHQRAVLAEFGRAKELQILDSYVGAEIKSCLIGGLVKEAIWKVLAYRRMKGGKT